MECGQNQALTGFVGPGGTRPPAYLPSGVQSPPPRLVGNRALVIDHRHLPPVRGPGQNILTLWIEMEYL